MTDAYNDYVEHDADELSADEDSTATDGVCDSDDAIELNSLYQTFENDPKVVKIIAGNATQSERTSWNRKRERLENIINSHINPISAEIQALEQMRAPYLDEVREIREEMVATCIHPRESLAIQPDGSYQCKFCNKKMKVNTNG